MKAMETVRAAREIRRARGNDWIRGLLKYFMELHGDREFADDKAVIGGIGLLGDMPVTVIAQQKGKNPKEMKRRNFGMMKPEGYRKVMRLIGQAEKFGRPVITLIDTPGAACGREAEERNQAGAVAACIGAFARLTVPSISIIIGEGGSGGALALGVTDEVWMLENSVYSILSPEGFASILWKDSSRAAEAAELMGLTAQELRAGGFIDRVIPEDEDMFETVQRQLYERLKQLQGEEKEARIERKYTKYRSM
ncbi:MAG: carboxyltransferase subunit alpha [Lachnospiraceae bacterium]|nr:carboxyltransferase subunit alpha [Lachnospiraceae bacterium]MDY5743014.1 carboxyltransferase subunit alpha [Lachnospiraceae bacterium]